MDGNAFLDETGERSDLNQYWFSQATIGAFADEIDDSRGSAALVSSPSVYFSLPQEARSRSRVLDYDRQWEADPGFVFYDFNAPEELPGELRAAFDFVLVDPPFITREVWEKYAATTRFLLRDGGKVLCTTIAENAEMMQELLGLAPVPFRPSIPNLVYQYSVYTNYTSERLAKLNPEIDDKDWRASADAGPQDPSQDPSLPNLLPGERMLCGSSKAPAGLGAEAAVDAALAAEAALGVAVVEESPPPPGAVLLAEFREQLGALKRSFEAVRVPLQQAVRRRAGGGEAARRAGAAAEVALGAAEAAAQGVRRWLANHGPQLTETLGEAAPEEAAAAGATQDDDDRWRVSAVLGSLAAARGDALRDMDAYQEWVNVGKQHSAEFFRLSSALLDRIKTLKREAAAGREASRS